VNKKKLFEFYNQSEEYFKSTEQGHLQGNIFPIHRKILNKCKKKKGLIVDLGCGTGLDVSKMVSNDNFCLGIDISELAVNRAKSRKIKNTDFKKSNLENLPLEKYNLRSKMTKMAKENKNNFLFTSIWPEYAQVMEFYNSSNCLAALTDSGGIQEEMNLLNKICFTCRFSTERPETVNDAHSNIIIPPVNGKFMFKIIDYVLNNQELKDKMQNSKKIYGQNVAKKFINIVKQLSKNKASLFNWTHKEIGLWREKDQGDFL